MGERRGRNEWANQRYRSRVYYVQWRAVERATADGGVHGGDGDADGAELRVVCGLGVCFLDWWWGEDSRA